MRENYSYYQNHIEAFEKDKTEITDDRLQKNSLGKALNMQLPSKERILIMKLNTRRTPCLK